MLVNKSVCLILKADYLLVDKEGTIAQNLNGSKFETIVNGEQYSQKIINILL